jgi:hypothetical protein
MLKDILLQDTSDILEDYIEIEIPQEEVIEQPYYYATVERGSVNDPDYN